MAKWFLLLSVIVALSMFHNVIADSNLSNVNFTLYNGSSITISYYNNVVVISHNTSIDIPVGSVVTVQALSTTESPCIEVNGIKSQGTATFTVNGGQSYNVTVTLRPIMVSLKVIYRGMGNVSITFQNGSIIKVKNGSTIILPDFSLIKLNADPKSGYVSNWSNGFESNEIWCFISQNETLTLDFTKDPSTGFSGGSNLLINAALGLLLLGIYLLQRYEKRKSEDI